MNNCLHRLATKIVFQNLLNYDIPLIQFELTFKRVGQPLLLFILKYHCAVSSLNFAASILRRISTRQEMKEWKDGGGCRKENSVDVEVFSGYKLFTRNMHFDLTQQTYITELLLLISAHNISLESFFLKDLHTH
jgi:hypothetical protein